MALLDKSAEDLREFGQAVMSMKETIRICGECHNIADEALCGVCSNPRRNQTQVLVVEKVTDLDSIEKTGLYRGLYHVLGGALSPMDGVTAEHLRFPELAARLDRLVREHGGVELIVATNPNTAGETTALYLRELFKKRPYVTLTRLARGLASGSHLEYADEMTLKHALEERK